MNKNLRLILIFVGAVCISFCFFYFYPAQIFEAVIKSDIGALNADLSLENIIYHRNFPDGLIGENIESIQLTVKGYVILFICILGLPTMLTYRSYLKNSISDEEE